MFCWQIKGIVIYWKLTKYHLFRQLRCSVGDGGTLFVVEFREVSSAGVEKVAGRTCRRISSATCRWLEPFCLGSGDFWTTRHPLWRGILQGTAMIRSFLTFFCQFAFCVIYKLSLVAFFCVYIMRSYCPLQPRRRCVCVMGSLGTCAFWERFQDSETQFKNHVHAKDLCAI